MGGPILWGPNNIASNLEGAIINNDNSLNKYDGAINYILNGHAELNTTGWATYADAAQATPVNGTGGSPSVTWTQTTTSPLDGTGSFVFTKDAVNRQGQGASYDFTIDSAQQAKVLTVSFDYIVGSGTFVAGATSVDSDLEVYLYDVTNSVLIQPSTYKLYSNSSTVAAKFVSNFQTPYNSTSYRLIFHCATTSASAYTVKFDNVVVSPSQYVYGTPITDWQAYTLTIGAVTTPPTQGAGATKNAWWRRVGDSMEIRFEYLQTVGGSVGSGTYLFPIPSGFSIDSNKISTSGTGANQSIGEGTGYNGSFVYEGHVQVYNTTNLMVYLGDASTSTTTIGSTFLGLGNTTVRFGFFAEVPILGWSSSVQMSDNAAQNVVTFATQGVAPTGTLNTSINVVKWSAAQVANDTVGGYNATTGLYTCATAGFYQVNGLLEVSGTMAASNYLSVYIYKNGASAAANTQQYSSGTQRITCLANNTILCNAGDTIGIYSQTNATSPTFTTGWAGSYFNISRISGPNSIGATETVAASYWLSANFAASTTVPINFDSKEYDSTGSVTTSATAWKFTAPGAGTYQVTGFIDTSAAAAFQIYKNGSNYKLIGYDGGANQSTAFATSLKLLAGEYIDLRPSGSVTITGGTLASVGTQIQIIKVGNY